MAGKDNVVLVEKKDLERLGKAIGAIEEKLKLAQEAFLVLTSEEPAKKPRKKRAKKEASAGGAATLPVVEAKEGPQTPAPQKANKATTPAKMPISKQVLAKGGNGATKMPRVPGAQAGAH